MTRALDLLPRKLGGICRGLLNLTRDLVQKIGQDREMKARTAARLAWLMAVLTFATFLGTMALVASRPPQLPRGIEPVELLDLLEYVPFLAFAGLGVLIADRRPQNPIGWMFTAIGFLVLGADFATEYALYAFTRILGHFSGEHSWLG